MKDFSALDDAILKHVRARRAPHPIYARHLNTLAAPLATVTSAGPDTYRLIDRRLQALRKRGLIQPDRKGPCGWRAVEEATP